MDQAHPYERDSRMYANVAAIAWTLSPAWHGQLAPVLIVVIVLAAVGTAILFGIGLIAYRTRRTLRYLLITVALGLLVARSIVGLGTVFGVVPMAIHHLVEHSFDFVIAMLILYAVYRSGPSQTELVTE